MSEPSSAPGARPDLDADPDAGAGADGTTAGPEADRSATVAADDGPEGTEFPLDAWSVEDRQLLDRVLLGEGVPHTWQGSTVVVPVAFQDVVDDLIDEIEEGGDDAAAGGDEWSEAVWDDDDLGDGPDPQEVLGAAFIAADRLARRASDPEGVVGMVDAHATLATMAPAFGFDEPVWTDLVAHVEVLAAALTAEQGSAADLGDERVEELAADLRTRLRPLV